MGARLTDVEFDALYAYMLDAMLAETGATAGGFYLLAADSSYLKGAHRVTGLPAFEKDFEAEFRRRFDGNQSPSTGFFFIPLK